LAREVKVDYDEGFINSTRIILYASLEHSKITLARRCDGFGIFVNCQCTSLATGPTFAAIAIGSTPQVGSANQ
jgi:hypothetical protein